MAKKTKKTYDVHVYAVVRVKVPDVAATSQQEACLNAMNSLDLDTVFPARKLPGGLVSEYADDITGFLVDEHGDEYHEKSQWRDKHGNLDKDLHLERRGV